MSSEYDLRELRPVEISRQTRIAFYELALRLIVNGGNGELSEDQRLAYAVGLQLLAEVLRAE